MKRKLAILLIGIILITIPIGAYADEKGKEDIFKLNCKSALLMEESTGKIVYDNNSSEKVYPASVTKVMTMLLVIEAVDSGRAKLTDKVVASPRAKSMGGSTMFLETGEIRTVEELLKGVAIESANDAAVALAEHFAGTEEGFAIKMNKRAIELGMKNSNFVNCTGFFSENHYTCAFDVAIMSRELLKHKKILDYTKVWQETISEGRKEPFTLTNRNKMVRGYKGCDGLKTGYIKESKYCIAATAKRGDIRFISVIMGAPTIKDRTEQAGKLLDYGFANYNSKKVVSKGEELGEISISKCKPEKIKIYSAENLNVIYEKGSPVNPQKKIDINKNIKPPVKKGEPIGVVKAEENGKVYGEVKIIAKEDILKLNFGDVIKKEFRYWLNLK